MKNGKLVKLSALLLAAIMLLSVAPFNGLGEVLSTTASAEEGTEGYYTYLVVGDKAIITKVDTEISGEQVIPPTLGGKAVAEIGSEAFDSCDRLTGITLPDTLTKIGYMAFYWCTQLTDITIPKAVTEIGVDAFYGCQSLTDITVEEDNPKYSDIDGVLFNKGKTLLIHYPIGNLREDYTVPGSVNEIGSHAFYNCKNLKNLIIPGSVKTIGYSAFRRCSNLTALTLENGVTRIFERAFEDCTSLTNFTIPESVTFVDTNAFSYCIELTSVNIPKSVTTIGIWAFSGCEKLAKITVHPENPNYLSDNGVLFNKDKTELILYPRAKGGTHYTVPSGVLTVGESSFGGCTNLTDIIISDSVTVIEDSAFDSCDNLANVTIGAGVTRIGDYAFYGCTSLAEITIPEGVTRIDNHAFEGCTDLETITLPDSLAVIGYGAFNDTAYYEDDSKWEDNVLYIGNHLIEANYVVNENYVIDEGTITVAKGAFVLEDIKSIEIPKSLTNIGESAFEDCEFLATVTVDEENPYFTVENGVLFNKNKTQLVLFPPADTRTTYDIPAGVTAIGYGAFYGCKNLTDISLPQGVTTIGNFAFSYCRSLETINIPDSVTVIGNYAFEGCDQYSDIDIPDSVTSVGSEAFNGTGYSNDGTKWEEGALYIGKHLVAADDTVCSDFAVKAGTKTIAGYIFAGNDNLKKVTVPESVVSIGKDAFLDCSSLTDITLGSGVTSIGKDAFDMCYSIRNVNYGSDREDWNNIAIGEGNNCLTNANFTFTEKTFTENGFIYTVDEQNKAKIVGVTPDIVGEVVIPATLGGKPVKTIGEKAFFDNDLITKVTIPEGVTVIEGWAFKYCDLLASVTIPVSVTNIGDLAFYNCNALTDVYYNGGKTGWNNITIGGSNECLLNATRHYAIQEDFTEGNFTYIVDDEGNVKITEFKPGAGGDVVIPATLGGQPVKTIGYKAFFDNDLVTSVVIPEGVTVIEGWAFKYMDNLAKVTLPKSITQIGEFAFYGCPKLKDVYYGGSRTDWDDINIIGDNSSLTNATRHFAQEKVEGDYTYTVYNGCATITAVADTISGDVVIPATLGGYPVTGINREVFKDRDQITKLTIPDSVKEIGEEAFSGCSGITELTVGRGVTTIGNKAFFQCSALKKVTLGNRVKTIGEWAFKYCSALETLYMPDSVTDIGELAFYNCTSLADVYYGGFEEDWNDINIGNSNEWLLNANRHYAEEIVEGDFTYTVYNGCATITDVDDTITGDVEIPETLGNSPVIKIGKGAFSGCNALESVTIPESVTTIGDGAFENCVVLADVFYNGSAEAWNNVYVGDGNGALTGATRHYVDYSNSALPETTVQTAKYKNNVTVKITATGIPATGFLVVDGTKIAPDANGTAVFEAKFQAKESKTFKAHIEDKNGNIKVAEKEYKVNVDTGFFAKLVAFFVDFIFNGFKWKEALVNF